MRACLIFSVALAACSQETERPPAPMTEEEEIAAFCNTIAAELVANPNSDAPLRKLMQKHLEEEWDYADVDRICSDAVERKRKLIYGN